jgi:uncharacterized membrane protein
MLYAFIGWLVEVAYAAYKEKRFVNKGFLAGPICPIYGFGALLILGIDKVIKSESMPFYMSISSAVVVTTFLEYVTGYVMEKLLDIKAWDYSKEVLNLHGWICLKFSLFWGMLAYVQLTVLQPVLSMYVNAAAQPIKQIIAVLLLGMIIIHTAKALGRTDTVRKIIGDLRMSAYFHSQKSYKM